MKHIKLFESIKDKYEIENILLEFEYDVYEAKVSDDLKIELTFKDSLIGFDKLKVVDDIITRLKKTKYNKIYIEDNFMCIGENINNINDTRIANLTIVSSLVEEVKKLLDDKLSDLKGFQARDYKNLTLYGKDKNNIVLNYNRKKKELYVSYNKIWELFDDRYMLKDDDIRHIMQHYVVNILQIKVLSTRTNKYYKLIQL